MISLHTRAICDACDAPATVEIETGFFLCDSCAGAVEQFVINSVASVAPPSDVNASVAIASQPPCPVLVTDANNPERKQPEAEPEWLGSQDPVRRSTAGTGLQVGEASADLPATSEFMDATAGETAINSITTAAQEPPADPLRLAEQHCRASDVEASSGKRSSEEVETGGKDCNADSLAVRAVIYPAPRGASHGASNSDPVFSIPPAPVTSAPSPVTGAAPLFSSVDPELESDNGIPTFLRRGHPDCAVKNSTTLRVTQDSLIQASVSLSDISNSNSYSVGA